VLRALSPAPLERHRHINPAGLVIGRDGQTCDHVVTGTTISRRHCRIYREAQSGWIVEDLDSTNGLFVDGQRVQGSQTLRTGQVVGLGSPRVPDFEFVVESEKGSPRRWRLDPAERWIVGRDLSADISLPADPATSSHHAEIIRKNGRLRVRDLQSLNGTWVDGQRVRRAELMPDSVVTVGDTRLELALEELGALQVTATSATHEIKLQCLDLVRTATDWLGRDQRRLLESISLAVEPGEFVGILGPSGAGKTTLLRALNGYGPPDSGEVLFNDTPLYAQFDLYRHLIGYVPQDDIIHRELTVRDCLSYIAAMRLPADLGEDERRQILQTTLENLGLTHVADQAVESLSGGQRKRVSIAAELVTRPGILFLDEPTSGLDPSSEERLMLHFRNLAASGKTVLITTHILYNLDLLDRVIILARGRLCFFGTPQEAMNFFAEGSQPLERPTRIFEILEGAEDPGISTAAVGEDEMVRIADKFARRYRNSTYIGRHVVDHLSESARERFHPTSERPGADTGKAKPARRARQWPSWNMIRVLARRHTHIRMSSLRGGLIYLLVPIALALVTLTMSIPPILSEQEAQEQRDHIAAILDNAPFSPDSLFQQLFSPPDVDDPRPALEIVHEIQHQSLVNLPIPVGVLLMFVMTAVFTGTLMACLEVSGEWDILEREYMACLGIGDYLLSKLPFLFGLTAIQVALFLGICLLKPELRELNLLPTYVAMLGMAWTALTLGLLVSALDPTRGQMSVVLALVVVLPQLVLSGALGPDFYSGMNPLTQRFADALPARWGLEMLLTAAFDQPDREHWRWIAQFVPDQMGFRFGDGVYRRGLAFLIAQGIGFMALTNAVLRRGLASR